MGAYLARAGHDVTLVDIVSEHVAAINRSGLAISGPIAAFTTPLPAFTPDALHGAWDTIILATKAQHTAAAVRALLPHLTAAGCVVSAQNGLNELTIAEAVGEARTVGAFVNFGADYLEPGVILYGGRGAVMIGEAFGAPHVSPRVLAIRDAWRDFDDRATATANIWGYLWGKEAYGAMLFATALTNDSIADGLARPEYRGLYIALAREILAVALARGVRPEAFDGFDPAAYLQEKWARTLEADMNRMCVDAFQKYYGFDGRRVYRPEFHSALYGHRLAELYPSLAARLAENKTGLAGHGLPALIVQGGTDFIVTSATQSLFVAALREAGSAVSYREYKGVPHKGTRQAGFMESVEWMEDVARGDAPHPD
jgi:2-dehydropantoate 2-reductase